MSKKAILDEKIREQNVKTLLAKISGKEITKDADGTLKTHTDYLKSDDVIELTKLLLDYKAEIMIKRSGTGLTILIFLHAKH